ncbi:MAG: polyprenol phosphomannose-dependent alpha 1,6 mannosyltransferase MptB [Mycobacteriales bacterium]
MLTAPPLSAPALVASPWSRTRLLGIGGAGTALSTAIVLADSRISSPEPAQRVLLGSWLGLLPTHVAASAYRLPLTVLVLAAVSGLVVVWAAVVRATARRRLGLRPTLAMWAAWTAPFAIGPPLFSRDVYSFVAQGRLAAHGLDPYRYGPATLGPSHLLAAVDPHWRHTMAPYGPIALWVQELAARAGGALTSVLVLRVVAVVSVGIAIWLGIRLAAPRPAAAVAALYGLNPIVLFHLVSGAHLEALLVATALAGVLLHRRGHPAWGVALASLSAAVKAPALAILGTLVLVDLVRARGLRTRGWVLLRDTAAAGLPWLGCEIAMRDPFGWVRALGTATATRTLATPAVALGHLGDWLLRLVRVQLGIGTALALSTALLAGIAVLWISRLLVTLPRRDLLRTAGFALVAVSILGPVIHPWYLMWGFALLVPAAAGGAIRTRRLLLVTSGLMALLELPGLTGMLAAPWSWLIGLSVTSVVLAATSRREVAGHPRARLRDGLRQLPEVLAGA